MKKYKVNRIFYSVQGEGARAGTPQVFLRFSGCNLKCVFCDTDHEPGAFLTSEEIIAESLQVGGGCRSVSFCGGEPTLQLDEELINSFSGWYKSIETNGLLPVPDGVDYVVCSPKTTKIMPERIDELRFIIKVGDSIPEKSSVAKAHYLSPCFDGEAPNKDNIKYCITLVKDNPDFKLSTQIHKYIGVE